jgi:hypothetical protein
MVNILKINQFFTYSFLLNRLKLLLFDLRLQNYFSLNTMMQHKLLFQIL